MSKDRGFVCRNREKHLGTQTAVEQARPCRSSDWPTRSKTFGFSAPFEVPAPLEGTAQGPPTEAAEAMKFGELPLASVVFENGAAPTAGSVRGLELSRWTWQI